MTDFIIQLIGLLGLSAFIASYQTKIVSIVRFGWEELGNNSEM